MFTRGDQHPLESIFILLILELVASSACGGGGAMATPVPPTATSAPPTDTPVPLTATPVPPTDTPVPPTATPVPPTGTPTPIPTALPSTGTPTPAPVLGPCCQPLQPGKAMIRFENHSGRLALVDLGPNYYEIPRKEGDVPTCLCPQLDPGHYMGIL